MPTTLTVKILQAYVSGVWYKMDGKADPKDDENTKPNAAEEAIPEPHTRHIEHT